MEYIDERGIKRERKAPKASIRWRWAPADETADEDRKWVCQSNTRMVTWSDGSKSLYIGEEVFDVEVHTTSSIQDAHPLLVAKLGAGILQPVAPLTQRVNLRLAKPKYLTRTSEASVLQQQRARVRAAGEDVAIRAREAVQLAEETAKNEDRLRKEQIRLARRTAKQATMERERALLGNGPGSAGRLGSTRGGPRFTADYLDEDEDEEMDEDEEEMEEERRRRRLRVDAEAAVAGNDEDEGREEEKEEEEDDDGDDGELVEEEQQGKRTGEGNRDHVHNDPVGEGDSNNHLGEKTSAAALAVEEEQGGGAGAGGGGAAVKRRRIIDDDSD